MTVEALIQRDAAKALSDLIGRVSNLEANDYYVPVSKIGVTSSPPTQVELDSILGAPNTYNSHTVALVKDTTNSRNWLCFGDVDTNDWYFIAVDNTYASGYNYIFPTVITSNASFTNGFFTVSGIPVNAKAIDVSIYLTGTSPGLYTSVHPNPGATSPTNHVSAMVQAAGVFITGSGTVGVTINSGNPQVYLTRGAPLSTLRVTCTGFYI